MNKILRGIYSFSSAKMSKIAAYFAVATANFILGNIILSPDDQSVNTKRSIVSAYP